MPTYYIMNREQNMPESVASYLPSADYAQDCAWMTEADLKFFSDEFIRTGFQGGLNWYRCGLSPEQNDELRLFGGKAIEVPSLYIAGEHDWGIYQRPGGIDRMRHACVKLQACAFIPGAGHWVQQEQPEPVVSHLLQFLKRPS